MGATRHAHDVDHRGSAQQPDRGPGHRVSWLGLPSRAAALRAESRPVRVDVAGNPMTLVPSGPIGSRADVVRDVRNYDLAGTTPLQAGPATTMEISPQVVKKTFSPQHLLGSQIRPSILESSDSSPPSTNRETASLSRSRAMTATIVKRAKYGLLRGGFGQIGDAKIAAMNQELASPTGNFSPCFARICYDMSARAGISS